MSPPCSQAHALDSLALDNKRCFLGGQKAFLHVLMDLCDAFLVLVAGAGIVVTKRMVLGVEWVLLWKDEDEGSSVALHDVAFLN